MNATGVISATALVIAFGAAIALAVPAVLRRGLGIVHPGAAWLVLTGVFFGVGSLVLAVTGESSGPALYVAGAVVSFAAGIWLSDRLAFRRGDQVTPERPPGEAAEPHDAPEPHDAAEPPPDRTWRWAPFFLAGLAIGAILPTLARHGVPLLTADITGSRSELTGLQIQLVRVALPGLAGILMFDAIRTDQRRSRFVALAGITAIFGFMVLLASRYLALELLAVLVIAWLLAGRWVTARIGVVLVLAAIVGFGGIQILRAYDQAAGNELGFALERTANRVGLVQPRTLAALQEVIPAEEPYFLGLTWIHRLGPLTGREDIPNLGYWIYPRVVQGAQGTAGYAAPGLIGEAWANFGPAGLVLFALLGVLAERLGALVAWRRHTAVDIVAGSLAILFVARTHALGLGGLGILAMSVVLWRLLAGPLDGGLVALRRVLTWR